MFDIPDEDEEPPGSVRSFKRRKIGACNCVRAYLIYVMDGFAYNDCSVRNADQGTEKAVYGGE